MAPTKHRTESRTSPRRIIAAERQRQALGLRKAGRTFAQIAHRLGYRSPQAAHYAVEAALRKTIQAPADDQRKLDLERLDVMLLSVWHRARTGEHRAIETILRILERRAKLLGLDAPSSVRLTDPDDRALGTTLAELIAAGNKERAIVDGKFRELEPGKETEADADAGDGQGAD